MTSTLISDRRRHERPQKRASPSHSARKSLGHSQPNALRPMKAIRANCLDCSESKKAVAYCPCDGVHSTRCHLWPYRFGCRPETARVEYGEAMVNPHLMPGSEVRYWGRCRRTQGTIARKPPRRLRKGTSVLILSRKRLDRCDQSSIGRDFRIGTTVWFLNEVRSALVAERIFSTYSV